MPEFDRSDVVLRFLVEHNIPLKPKTVYGGIIHHREVTYSYKQVRDSISQLRDRRLLRRVKVDADEGRIVAVDPDAGNVRCWYLPTDAGRDHVASVF